MEKRTKVKGQIMKPRGKRYDRVGEQQKQGKTNGVMGSQIQFRRHDKYQAKGIQRRVRVTEDAIEPAEADAHDWTTDDAQSKWGNQDGAWKERNQAQERN